MKSNPLSLPADNLPHGLLDELVSIVGKANETISKYEIVSFIENQFMAKSILRSGDLVLNTGQNYILAELATIYYDDKASFYGIEIEEGYELVNGYLSPHS